jgi:hypothetical protein
MSPRRKQSSKQGAGTDVSVEPGAATEKTPDDVDADFAQEEEDAQERAADARMDAAADDEADEDDTPSALDADADIPDENPILDDEEIAVETSVGSSDPLAADDVLPGADTSGLDAAPSPRTGRVGAGGAGDLTGLDPDEIEAADEEGADGSDIDIDDEDADRENPPDLVDLMGGAPRPPPR